MVTVIKKSASKLAINQLLGKLLPKKGLNAKKYCGVLKLKSNPLTIQQKLRNEWL
jgi:hypothetical protein